MNVNQQLSPRVLKSPQSKVNAKAFCTDVRQKSEIQEQGMKLRKFVEQIGKKIDYVQWKQDLVLKYNYLPLKRTAEKVQNQKINYINKIHREEQLGAHILSGKEITVQLDLFREFSRKLNQKMHQIELQIAQEKMKNDLLSRQARQKRERLKQRMRDNLLTTKSNLDGQGIKNKDQMKILVKSKSTKNKLNPSTITFRTQSARKTSDRKLSAQNTKRQLNIRSLNLYEQCLSQLVDSIQAMKSSQDIQSGIYLDIMQKNEKNTYKTQTRYTNPKSKIVQTLRTKYGHMQSKYLKHSQNKANFQMQWQTFKQLNWKQIMGIVLVKDKNCQKTKRLLKYK